MRSLSVAFLGMAFIWSAGASPAPAEDPKGPPPESKSSLQTLPKVDKGKAPEFAGYMFVTKVLGEVISSTDTDLKVRIYWQKATVKNNSNRGRPSISSGHHHHNPYMVRQPQIQVKWEHHDYTIPYHPESLVRTQHLPPKVSADGKKSDYSQAERDALKVPYAVPGYQASKSDLVTGTVVELSVIRDKSLPAQTVSDRDMRVKYAIILGQDPNPPKDLVNSASASTKKK